MSQLLPNSVPGYIIERQLGEGTAGVVYAARSLSHSSQYHRAHNSIPHNVAVKIIPRSKVRQAVRREVALQIALRHPNIARLYHVAPLSVRTQRHSHSISSQLALALIMDCAPAGDMFSQVAATGSLPPRILRQRLRHICQALQYLHSNNIAHLDVKLENVVICHDSVAKLIDFGCARRLDEKPDPSQPVPLAGTLHYLCPELLKNPAHPPAASSDAWSLGVLAYTALAGMYPFNGARRAYTEEQSDAATKRRILDASPHRIPSCVNVPSDLRTIIDGLLQKDVGNRMTIPQVIQILDKSISVSPIVCSQRCPQQEQQQPSKFDIARPPSPTAPADADFSESHVVQTVDEALYVVEDVQNNRLRPVAHTARHHFPNRAHDRIQITDRTN
ncbi:unnamed protein product [Agarophyton chilense]|eukprot:gb/GEZJ01000319.1/.p1 GENE.gb/GEZJ01000319.1/~~gb/GEZJ01000319.1/.p1  ORF type:complete len:417 (-),score=59.57 gb/GEZJ01000319.1/:2099-3265(-)